MTLPPSYGDVTGEYLALRDGAGLVEGVHDLVWVSGPDTVEFLDGLLSQSISGIEEGEAARSLLLAPHGKLRAVLWVLRDVGRIGLVSDAGLGKVVAGDLERFRLRVDVAIEPSALPGHGLWGPSAVEVAGRLGTAAPTPGRWVGGESQLVAHLPFQHSPLPRLAIGGYATDEVIAAGAVRVGALAATAVRVEVGEPVMSVDVDDATIPQEAGVVDGAVDFDKGCFLGQELVSRIDTRGRVNRHLRGLVITENVLPPPAAEVHAGDRFVGTLTSVGESLIARAPVALGVLRREAEPGDDVEIRWDGGSTTARVAELPMVP